ncbi:MAG: preprotein translocase subunit SecE [Cryomorphaceae bacterium]|nr:preprotein translocase subunit SecE [Cryomorphaceae bacterium]
MEKIRIYVRESYLELVNKTKWPTLKELQKSAAVVALASAIIAMVIYAMDRSIRFVLEGFYNLF